LGSRLDLSESRDVIGHVIIRFPIGHFLLAVFETESVSSRFRDISHISILRSLVWHFWDMWRHRTWPLDSP